MSTTKLPTIEELSWSNRPEDKINTMSGEDICAMVTEADDDVLAQLIMKLAAGIETTRETYKGFLARAKQEKGDQWDEAYKMGKSHGRATSFYAPI